MIGMNNEHAHRHASTRNIILDVGESRAFYSARKVELIAPTILAAFLALLVPAPSYSEAITQNPGEWRPMAYANLQQPAAATATYADIWKDAIVANNRAYLERGDMRFVGGNAPVTEAHFTIWSAKKSVVLSILNTATGCALKEIQALARATIKLCPLRIAIYEGVQVRTLDGGRSCFLELSPAETGAPANPSQSAAYAAYDVATRTVKTGLVLNHQAVEGCSQNISLRAP